MRNCSFIPAGVDLDDFGVDAPPAERPDRALFFARRERDENKGVEIVRRLQPLALAAGFEVAVRVGPPAFDTAGMRACYNGAAYVLCASRSEATANCVMEGAACGCVPVSTPVGTLRDCGHDGADCVLVKDQSAEAMLDGLLRARRDRPRLAAGAAEMARRYDYRPLVRAYWDEVIGPLASGRTPKIFSCNARAQREEEDARCSR